MGFSKTELGNDWVDYALFFLCGLLCGGILWSLLDACGFEGFIPFLISLLVGIGSGFWVISGEPEDLDKQFKFDKCDDSEASSQK